MNFAEVNLRFYVRRKVDNDWRRGVVFVREIVSKPFISWTANLLYHERYKTLPTRHFERANADTLEVGYWWKQAQKWNKLEAVTGVDATPIAAGTEEEFICQHFWGYSSHQKYRTTEYEVWHPNWAAYALKSYRVDCDFGKLYGDRFAFLAQIEPASVFVAEGSEIAIYGKKEITAAS